MLRPQDIMLLCLLAGRKRPWTIAEVAKHLGLAPSAVHRSLLRTGEARLYDPSSRRVNVRGLEELLVHAVRYLLPARMGGETRGIPTAWSAIPLAGRVGPVDESPVVWAHPRGEVRGLELEPIHPRVPEAAFADQELAARLSLVDALRAGGARVRREAAAALGERLRASPESG
jgi:IclR helix-turn-helix domain